VTPTRPVTRAVRKKKTLKMRGAAVAALRQPPELDPPTADTLRRAAAAKQFIEALVAEQQGRVAAARAARSR